MDNKPEQLVFTGFTIGACVPEEGADVDLTHSAIDIGVGNRGEEPLVFLRVCGRCFCKDLIDVMCGGGTVDEEQEA